MQASHPLLTLRYVGALCNELLWCAQERELQADLQQLLAQLVMGAGQPGGPPALSPAVQQTAKRVLGHSCAVASFSPADSAQLQLLSWLADAQVFTISCNASFVIAKVETRPLCYAFHRTDRTLRAVSGRSVYAQDASEDCAEQLSRLTCNLWFAWHQHVWGQAMQPPVVLAGSQLSSSTAGLSAMVQRVISGERTPLAERAGKALQLRLASRHLSRLGSLSSHATTPP